MQAMSEAVRAGLPRIVTALPGPRARAVIERDDRVMSPSYTRCYPLVAARAEGAIVEDSDGNHFLDFSAGIAVASTGHCHPRVVEAIHQQSARLIHMSGTDFYYPQMVDLAERLAAVAPGRGPHRVYFGNSGAEAIEAAMKLARYHTGRDKFIAFLGSFHGRTMGALSLTASRAVQRRGFGPLVPGVFHAPYPNVYRSGRSPDECAAESIGAIERLFATVAPPEEVAAIVFEPVQGEGGYIIPPQQFIDGLHRLAAKHGILLVADEVQSGAGRTGKMWACQHFGLVPDILTSAKGLASGMPISAMVARADLMDWGPGAHASTFGGNPVCCAAAMATLDLLQGGLIDHAARMGAYMLARMHEWPRRFPLVGDVRGLGLMLGVEIVKDQASRAPAHELRDALVASAFERGLLTLGAGENTLRLSPPLIINVEQADCACQIIEDCLTALSAAQPVRKEAA
jgi:4-aminobutyrate aminotransferase